MCVTVWDLYMESPIHNCCSAIVVVWSVDSDALQLHGKTIIVVVFSSNSNRRRSSRKNNRNNYNSTAVVVVGTVVAVLIKIA